MKIIPNLRHILFFKGLFFCFMSIYSQQEGTLSYIQSDSLIILRFNESIDSVSLLNRDYYTVDKGVTISRLFQEAADFQTLVLVSTEKLLNPPYSIMARDLKSRENPAIVLPDITFIAEKESHPWYNIPTNEKEGMIHKGYWSNLHDRLVGYSVYLPNGYATFTDTIPVIYFLGGLGNNENSQYAIWIETFHKAIEKGEIPPTGIVFPNPMPGSWYEDAEPYRTETMVIQELLPHIDTSYRFFTSREGRWISGFSMGGYGSLRLGFRYPELFGSVVSYACARVSEVYNPDQIRGRTSILMAVGEADSYLLFGAYPIFKELQQLNIPSVMEGLPGVEHSIHKIFNIRGIDDIRFHWNNLGGFNRPPEVHAGEDMIVKYMENAKVKLSGKVEDDHFSGYPLSYWWSLTGNPLHHPIFDSLSLDPVITFTEEGEYFLVLNAFDTRYHVKDTLKIKVTSNPPNQPPQVKAGRDILLQLPHATFLTTPVISDDNLPESSVLEKSWKAFPSDGVLFENSQSAITNVTFFSKGLYKLLLEVSDTDGVTSDSFYVTVLNQEDIFPALYFGMDEGTRDTAWNLAGVNCHLVNRNTRWVKRESINGYSLFFPGNQSYGKLDHQCGLFNMTETLERTISFSFRTTNNRSLPQVLYDEGCLNDGICIYKTGGFIHAVLASEENRVSIQTIFDYTKGWQNLVLKINNEQIRMYLNGNLVGEKYIDGFQFQAINEPIGIGASVGTNAASIAGGQGTISQFYEGYMDSLTITTKVPDTGTPRSISDNQLLLYPVPTSDILIYYLPCTVPGEMYDIAIYSLSGKQLISIKETLSDNQGEIMVGQLDAGFYFLNIRGNDFNLTRKFIISP